MFVNKVLASTCLMKDVKKTILFWTTEFSFKQCLRIWKISITVRIQLWSLSFATNAQAHSSILDDSSSSHLPVWGTRQAVNVVSVFGRLLNMWVAKQPITFNVCACSVVFHTWFHVRFNVFGKRSWSECGQMISGYSTAITHSRPCKW